MGDGARRPADAVAPRRSALIAQEPFDLGGEIVPARELLVVGLLHPFEELAYVVVGGDRSVEARTLGMASSSSSAIGISIPRWRARCLSSDTLAAVYGPPT